MKVALLAVLAFSSTHALARCGSLNLSGEITMEEKGARNGRDFKLKIGKEKIGEIFMRNPEGKFQFEIRDAQKGIVVRAKEEDSGNDLRISVKDCENRLLGTIRGKGWRNTFNLNKVYQIFDAVGREQGSAKKNEFLSTQYDVKDYTGNVAMVFNRPAVDLFKDSWKLNITSQSVNPLVAILLPVHRTSEAYREELREKEEERREDERDERRDREKDEKKKRERERERQKEKERERERRRN